MINYNISPRILQGAKTSACQAGLAGLAAGWLAAEIDNDLISNLRFLGDFLNRGYIYISKKIIYLAILLLLILLMNMHLNYVVRMMIYYYYHYHYSFEASSTSIV